jgi:predicted transglutaminase-like cysteine proteinase
LRKKVFASVTVVLFVLIALVSFFIFQLPKQNNYDQQQNTSPNPTPLQYVDLQIRLYETNPYWNRDSYLDLPVYNSIIKYEVTNTGNKEATNIKVIFSSEGFSWEIAPISLIQTYQSVTGQAYLAKLDYDKTKALTAEASCESSSDRQTYTINAKLPRSEYEFKNNQDMYKLYITPNDPTIQSLVPSITTNPLIPNWMEIRDWVSNKILYQSDSTIHGKIEYWKLPRETLRSDFGYFTTSGQKVGTGDCEDYAILAVSLLRADGWSPNDVYVVTGRTTENGQTVGHAFVKINILGLWYYWEPQAETWITWLLSDISLSQYTIDGTFNDQNASVSLIN